MRLSIAIVVSVVSAAAPAERGDVPNVTARSSGAAIAGPINCSGSRGKQPVAIDGEVSGYGPSIGYMYAYLKTPLVVKLGEPAFINSVEMLLLDTDRRDYGYVIETSVDGRQWEVAVDRANARDRSWQLHRFERRRVGLIRVRFTRTSVSIGSYHVVEIAAYDLPDGMAKTPLRKKWEAGRVLREMRGVRLLGANQAQTLLTGELLNAARSLARNQVVLRDLDQDGDPDVLSWREHRTIVVALDDNDDLTWQDVKPDGRDDCLAVDLGADGRLDRSVDYSDTDGNGLADVMVQTYVSGSPWGRQAMALIVDLDQRGPKRLWHLTLDYGYSQGLCQWQCDFGGDGYFVLFKRDPKANEWVGSFETPFCFYDPDGDGFAEETVRVSGRGRRLRSVRYGVNADNDTTEGEDYDYDLSVTSLGSVEPAAAELTRFRLRTGEQTGEYLKWDRTREVVRGLPWQRALLVWDESDHNVARGRAQKERWEGVINSSYRGLTPQRRFPQEGGPPCGHANRRFELDADFSGKMKLYYWPADRRLHLFGAEDGRLTVDYNYDGKTDMTVEYRDRDGDGFFDRREMTTRDASQRRAVVSTERPTQVMALAYAEIAAVWPQALDDTLAEQVELLSALSKVTGRPCLPGGPLHFYQSATKKQFRAAAKMRQSREARRYYQDVEIELSFAELMGRGKEETAAEKVRKARELADRGLLREAAECLTVISAPRSRPENADRRRGTRSGP